MKKTPLIIASLCFLTINLKASDHIDGPLTMKQRQADLSDFYAYPTPNKPGYLSLILNSYPIVSKSGHFADKGTFAFIIRRATIAGNKEKSKITTSGSDEVIITCNVVTPNDITKHKINCSSNNGLKASNIYNQITDIQPGDDFRLFAGMRSDPFFFNTKFAEAATKGTILKPKNKNIMEGINDLSIVIEIDSKKLFPNNSVGLLALATEIYTQESSGAPLNILDRIGRPEITNVSMFPDKNEELRDVYNTQPPFTISAEQVTKYNNKTNELVANYTGMNLASKFHARLMHNISHYDSLDNKIDLPEESKIALANLLLEDFLVLDLSKPYSAEDSFFEIEKSILKGKTHTTSGGRQPNDDIMDTLFTLYIAGLDGARIRDGVDAPAKHVSIQFPYLVEPELGFWAQRFADVARWVFGLD